MNNSIQQNCRLHKIPTIRSSFIVICLIAARAISVCAAVDTRIAQWDYDQSKVYDLSVPTYGHVHISLEEGEKFINLGAGNTSVIDVGAEGSQIVIKAKQAVKHTNLTLLTDRRVYIFDYSSSPLKTNETPSLFSVRFNYPKIENGQSLDATKRISPNQGGEEKISTSSPAAHREYADSRERNVDYWYQGPREFKPIEVFDNGLQTTIRFAPQTPLPSLYVVEADGSESLVNLHVYNDQLVLHRVAAHWVLKRGDITGLIQNRSFDSKGIRADNGAVDERTERSVINKGQQ